MRKEILLNQGWLFHKGDIKVNQSKNKGLIYTQSKTERKLIGPAAYKYFDTPDRYFSEGELKDDNWNRVETPHDYVITQDNSEEENCTLGYFSYENAWYRKHFTLPEGNENKR